MKPVFCRTNPQLPQCRSQLTCKGFMFWLNVSPTEQVKQAKAPPASGYNCGLVREEKGATWESTKPLQSGLTYFWSWWYCCRQSSHLSEVEKVGLLDQPRPWGCEMQWRWFCSRHILVIIAQRFTGSFGLEGTSGLFQSSFLPKPGSATRSDQVSHGFDQSGLKNLQGWRLLVSQPFPELEGDFLAAAFICIWGVKVLFQGICPRW